MTKQLIRKLISFIGLLIVISLGTYFFTHYIPNEITFSTLCKTYLRTTQVEYVLPAKYQNRTEKVPSDVVNQYKNSIKSNLSSMCVNNSRFFKNELSNINSSIDEQAKKQLIFYKNEITIGNVLGFKITGNKAKVTIKITVKQSFFYSGGTESCDQWQIYNFELIKANSKWKIASCTYDANV